MTFDVSRPALGKSNMLPGVLIRIERVGSLVSNGPAYNRRDTPRLLRVACRSTTRKLVS